MLINGRWLTNDGYHHAPTVFDNRLIDWRSDSNIAAYLIDHPGVSVVDTFDEYRAIVGDVIANIMIPEGQR